MIPNLALVSCLDLKVTRNNISTKVMMLQMLQHEILS